MELHALLNAGFISVVLTVFTVVFVLYKYPAGKCKSNVTAKRRLGKLEEVFRTAANEQQGIGDIALTLTLRSKKKLVKDHVREALVMVAKRQPMLRARIETNTSLWTSVKSEFIIDDQEVDEIVDLRTLDVKARDWTKVWYEESSARHQTGRLWHVTLLQEEFLQETKTYANTLLFCFCHAVMDGVSSMKFCNQFLGHVNKISLGLRPNEDELSSLSLLPSFTDLLQNGRPRTLWNLVKEYSVIFYLSKKVYNSLFKKQLNPFIRKFFSDQAKTSCLPRGDLNLKTFSKCETANILKACKENGSSVTGAMMTAAHLAFCKLIQDSGCIVEKEAHLEHLLSINSQRHCCPKPPDDYLGEFAFASPFYMAGVNDVKNADFLALARETTKRIRNWVEEGKHIDEFLDQFYTFSGEEFSNKLVCSGRKDLIRTARCNLISSTGSFDFHQEENGHTYNVHECCCNALISSVTISFAHSNTTVNGKMSWAVISNPAKTSHNGQAEQFANACFDYFTELAQEQK